MGASQAERFRKLRESLKAQGICTVCRKEPARLNQIKCDACASKQVEYMRRVGAERQARRECRNCGIPLDPSIRMIRCPVCQERARELINLGRNL